MPSTAPTLSVVICAPTSPSISTPLLAAIESLRAQQLPAGDAISLVLAFNGPGTPPPPPAPAGAIAEVAVLHAPLRGKSHAANLALAQVRTEFILWGDDDMVYDADWAAHLVAALRRHSGIAVTGAVEIAPELLRPWMRSCHLNRFGLLPSETTALTLLLGGNMGQRRAPGAALPAFDPDLGPGTALGTAEDVLFSLMLQAAGVRLVTVPEARAIHRFSSDRLTARAITRISRSDGRSHAYIDYHWFHRDGLASPRMRLAVFGGALKHHLQAGPLRLFSGRTTGSWKFHYWISYLRQMRAMRGQPRRYSPATAATAVPATGSATAAPLVPPRRTADRLLPKPDQPSPDSMRSPVAYIPETMITYLARKLIPRPLIERVREVWQDRYALSAYSQEGEDLLLRRIFGDARSGYYVDVGAHHPRRFSNTHYFYKRGWHGINIDAKPGSMRLFHALRPRDRNLEIAISDQAGEVDFFLYAEPALNGFSPSTTIKTGSEVRTYDSLRSVRVPARPLADILDEYKPPAQPISFLTIDVEGADLLVLKSNNWEKHRPAIVVVEMLSDAIGTKEDMPAWQYLDDQGYELFAKTLFSRFFRRRDPP